MLLLVHAPPDVPSVNVVRKPVHNADNPAIVAGTGFTVTVVVVMQPVPSE